MSADVNEILDLLRLCSSQVIATFGGVAGLQWKTVRDVARDLGIDTAASWFGVAPWWEAFRVAESEWVAVVNKPKPKAEGGAEE